MSLTPVGRFAPFRLRPSRPIWSCVVQSLSRVFVYDWCDWCVRLRPPDTRACPADLLYCLYTPLLGPGPDRSSRQGRGRPRPVAGEGRRSWWGIRPPPSRRSLPGARHPELPGADGALRLQIDARAGNHRLEEGLGGDVGDRSRRALPWSGHGHTDDVKVRKARRAQGRRIRGRARSAPGTRGSGGGGGRCGVEWGSSGRGGHARRVLRPRRAVGGVYR